MTAAAFEARSYPMLLNEIKETKLYTNTSPAAGINFLLATVGFRPSTVSLFLNLQSAVYLLSRELSPVTKHNSIYWLIK
jgi:hypothetical protein